MATFGEYDILINTLRPIQAARLEGDGWHIDIKPTDDGLGLEVYASGNVDRCSDLAIDPSCRNIVHLSVRAVDPIRQEARAKRVKEGHEQNERDDVFKTRQRGIRGSVQRDAD